MTDFSHLNVSPEDAQRLALDQQLYGTCFIKFEGGRNVRVSLAGVMAKSTYEPDPKPVKKPKKGKK